MAAVSCVAQTGSGSLAEAIARGKAYMDSSRFHDAEAQFRQAIERAPDSGQAHLLLARALLAQLFGNLRLVPATPAVLPQAAEAARKAVALLPGNAEARCVSGMVNYQTALTLKEDVPRRQKLMEALEDFKAALAIDPKSAEAHTDVARMTVEESLPVILGARLQSGMKPGQSGRIAKPEVRRMLRERYGLAIEEGLAHAHAALATDPGYEAAMSQMAALLLLRANYRESDTEYAADFKEGSNWQAKVTALRASRTPKNPVPANPAGGVIGGIIGSVPTSPPKQ